MFSKELRKLIIENRMARLSTNGKDNFRVQKKLGRELKRICGCGY